ncbi:MAG: hypothetical protein JNJ54_29325 [Myxococcaceae bacterium]|nr:hypothetical protein [Myxococcaceae bacterium]
MSMTMTRWVMMGFVCGVLVSTSSSCGGKPPCNTTTCSTGCCDATGTCQMGNTNSACGARGGACTACGLGSVCMFGGTCSGNNNSGGGFSGTGGGATGGGFATGGGTTGGGFATGGGSTGGGSTGGGFATGGGSTGGGSVTGGGTAGGPPCSPTTCLGCCLNGVCQNGNLAQACGRAGNQCAVCNTGDVCSAFGTCTSGSGGGSAGGTPACNTCLAQTGGQLVCVPTGTNLNVTTCGSNGGFCQNCIRNGFTACTNGVCTGAATGGGSATGGGFATGGGSPTGGGGTGGGAPATGVGSPCTSSGQCQSMLGPTAFCKTQTTPTPGFTATPYPYGFCTLPCASNGQSTCGVGNVCAGGVSSSPALFNETDRFCINGCTMQGQCPSPLSCVEVSDETSTMTVGGCWLDLSAPGTTFTGGGLPNRLGQSCTNNAGCSNPPDPALGTCFGGTEVPAMTFVGGLCMAYTGFAPDSYCVQAGGLEVLLRTRADGGLDFWCGQSCFALGATPRTGYRCAPVYYPDAGLKGGIVWPQRCATSSDCSTVMGATECNTAYGQCCVTASSPLTAQNCTGLTGI